MKYWLCKLQGWMWTPRSLEWRSYTGYIKSHDHPASDETSAPQLQCWPQRTRKHSIQPLWVPFCASFSHIYYIFFRYLTWHLETSATDREQLHVMKKHGFIGIIELITFHTCLPLSWLTVTKSDRSLPERDESAAFGEYFRRQEAVALRGEHLVNLCFIMPSYITLRITVWVCRWAVFAPVYLWLQVAGVSQQPGAAHTSCLWAEGAAESGRRDQKQKDPQRCLMRLQHHWAQVPW